MHSFPGIRRGAERSTRGRVRSPERNRQRRVTTRTAQHYCPPGDQPNDRIIDVSNDRAVVHEVKIGQAAETFDGFVFVNADRLIAQISACGHDWKIQFPKKQMMKRRIRQHDAEIRISWCDRIGQL